MTDTEILAKRPTLARRFEVVGLLGEGAAGTVYRVRDKERDNEEVALKILTNLSAFDEHTLERFRQEIRICQKIHHENIVHAHGLIGVDDTIAYTMEYVPGCDLGSLMSERAIDLSEIQHIFCQILSALHELHSHGVVHRDLKLENILIRNDGVVKISDLGLMKELDGEGLTKTGILLGTAQYLPPEYIRTGVYDEKGDLYATGAMMLELLSGNRRLSDKQGMEAINHLIKTKFAIPAVALQGLTKKYAHIVSRAMEPKPSRRYQTALEMKAALESDDGCVQSTPAAGMESTLRFSALHCKFAKTRGRKTFLFFLLGLGLSLVALLGSFFLLRSSKNLTALDFGLYEAEIAEGNRKTSRLQFRSDQRGVFVKYEEGGCGESFQLIRSSIFLCGQKRYSVNIESNHDGVFQGRLTDLETSQSRRIEVKRSTRTLLGR